MHNKQFIAIFELVFFMFHVLGPIYMLIVRRMTPGFASSDFFLGFILANMLFGLVGSIGLFFRLATGYYLLKAYLYLLVLGFPLGTVLAYASLRFIRKNNVKKEFRT